MPWLQYFQDIISKHIEGRRATHGFRKADRVDLIDGYGTRFLRSLRWFVTTRKADCDYSNMCWVGAVRWHGATVWSPAPGPVPGPPRGLPPTVLLGGLLLSGLLLSGRLVAESQFSSEPPAHVFVENALPKSPSRNGHTQLIDLGEGPVYAV